MKTPWKFLVELASRRRPSGAEPDALESEAEHTPARPFDNPTEAPGTADRDAGIPVNHSSLAVEKADDAADAAQPTDLPIGEMETTTLNAAQPSATEAADEAPQGKQSTEFLTTPRVERRQRKQRPPPARRALASQIKIDTQNLRAPGTPFLNEVVILDKEIQELRTLLAQKLHLQNRQLKRMLERFDGR